MQNPAGIITTTRIVTLKLAASMILTALLMQSSYAQPFP